MCFRLCHGGHSLNLSGFFRFQFLGSPFTAFIVRVWREKTDGESFLWRGSVSDAQSGERLYFQSLDQLEDVIARMIESEPRESPTVRGESIL